MDSAGCRRLWVLVDGLPPDAAVWREEMTGRWTTADHLVALGVELLDRRARDLMKVMGGDPKGKPLEIERPGAPEKEEKTERATSPSDVARFFGQIQ